MAQRYFGTDDPTQIQNLFRDLPTALDSARTMRDASGGSSFFVASPTEIYRTIGPNRAQPWVVNNTLTIDPAMTQFLNFAYTLRSDGLDAQVGQWSEEWFTAKNDNLTNAAGDPIQIFASFMPTWGLPFVIMPNAGETFGDWGIVPGPMPYQWGGTWLGVTNVARNPEVASEFVRFVALDEAHLRNWATGVFTNDYLRRIYPGASAGLAQAPGDLVSSHRLVRELTPFFNDALTTDFLGGQNHYQIFGVAAPNVSLAMLQGTDSTIGDAFIDAMDLFITGQAANIDEALASFRSDVRIALPGLNVPN